MHGLLGLIEMLLFFGLVFGWAFWQWWDWRRWKHKQREQEPPE